MKKHMNNYLDALKCLEELYKCGNHFWVADKTNKAYTTIKQALLNKSKKEDGFEKIQSIIDTWMTSNIMDNESALREIEKIIFEVIK